MTIQGPAHKQFSRFMLASRQHSKFHRLPSCTAGRFLHSRLYFTPERFTKVLSLANFDISIQSTQLPSSVSSFPSSPGSLVPSQIPRPLLTVFLHEHSLDHHPIWHRCRKKSNEQSKIEAALSVSDPSPPDKISQTFPLVSFNGVGLSSSS